MLIYIYIFSLGSSHVMRRSRRNFPRNESYSSQHLIVYRLDLTVVDPSYPFLLNLRLYLSIVHLQFFHVSGTFSSCLIPRRTRIEHPAKVS